MTWLKSIGLVSVMFLITAAIPVILYSLLYIFGPLYAALIFFVLLFIGLVLLTKQMP